jgi:hypothetical protein
MGTTFCALFTPHMQHKWRRDSYDRRAFLRFRFSFFINPTITKAIAVQMNETSTISSFDSSHRFDGSALNRNLDSFDDWVTGLNPTGPPSAAAAATAISTIDAAIAISEAPDSADNGNFPEELHQRSFRYNSIRNHHSGDLEQMFRCAPPSRNEAGVDESLCPKESSHIDMIRPETTRSSSRDRRRNNDGISLGRFMKNEETTNATGKVKRMDPTDVSCIPETHLLKKTNGNKIKKSMSGNDLSRRRNKREDQLSPASEHGGQSRSRTTREDQLVSSTERGEQQSLRSSAREDQLVSSSEHGGQSRRRNGSKREDPLSSASEHGGPSRRRNGSKREDPLSSASEHGGQSRRRSGSKREDPLSSTSEHGGQSRRRNGSKREDPLSSASEHGGLSSRRSGSKREDPLSSTSEHGGQSRRRSKKEDQLSSASELGAQKITRSPKRVSEPLPGSRTKDELVLPMNPLRKIRSTTDVKRVLSSADLYNGRMKRAESTMRISKRVESGARSMKRVESTSACEQWSRGLARTKNRVTIARVKRSSADSTSMSHSGSASSGMRRISSAATSIDRNSTLSSCPTNQRLAFDDLLIGLKRDDVKKTKKSTSNAIWDLGA